MPPRDRLLAALVAVLWGANFLAIHVGLQHFPPLVPTRVLLISAAAEQGGDPQVE